MRLSTLSSPPLLVLALLAAGGAHGQDDPLRGITAPGAQAELVQAGFQFTEGPVCAPDGTLYFSDIPANRIHRVGPDGKVALFRENTNGANGLAFDRKGRLLACEGGTGRVVALEADGGVSVVAASHQGRRFVRPNDLVPDGKGGVYFTDPGPRPMPGQTSEQKPSVYYVRPNGETLLISADINRPNGIILSLDGKTLLIADSAGEEIIAYDVQPDGSGKNRRAFAKVREATRTAEGTVRSGADGMAVDRQGRLYVTALNGIQVFDRDGRYLAVIPVPRKPSNLAFGGPDRGVLYITAGDSLFRLRMTARGPEGRAK